MAPRGKIYAFEPVRANFNGLKHNIFINKLHNVVVEQVGISDSKRVAEIYLEKVNTGGHSLHKEKYENPKTIRGSEKVRLVTLMSIFEKYKINHCNFLKIDVEGDEWNILRVLPKEFFDRIDKIALEFHPNVDEIRIAKFLHSRGFRVTIDSLGEILGMIYAWK